MKVRRGGDERDKQMRVCVRRLGGWRGSVRMGWVRQVVGHL